MRIKRRKKSMAEVLEVAADDTKKKISKLFQSGRINFLIGAGASCPAINVVGNIEKEVNKLYQKNKDMEARQKLMDIVKSVYDVNEKLVSCQEEDENIIKTKGFYNELAGNIERILNERRTNILPKQANIFTTNYDCFIESSFQDRPIMNLNDGFNRTPTLSNKFKFSAGNFFKSFFNNGNIYDYKVELPSVNLFKLHGSMTWKKDNETNEIIFEIRQYQERQSIDDYLLVLPMKDKARESVLNHVYYDLLRIYSNELDRNNTALFVFGFSFSDEHILDLTKRAMKNPTLIMVLFPYDLKSVTRFSEMFKDFQNVIIIKDEKDDQTFESFNNFLNEGLPSKVKPE